MIININHNQVNKFHYLIWQPKLILLLYSIMRAKSAMVRKAAINSEMEHQNQKNKILE